AALETSGAHPHIECKRIARRLFTSVPTGDLSMTIVRYEPWTLFGRLHRQLDQALGETDAASVSWIPRVDIREETERFVVTADLPGVDNKDIEITADKGVLTIRGQCGSEK